MLDKINDIKLAFDSKAYQSALALALTLPDICSEIEYKENNGKNYSKWCDAHINHNTFHIDIPGFEGNELTGTMIYLLRNAVLHSGSTKIKNDYGIIVNSFSFWITENNTCNFGFEYAQKSINGKKYVQTKIDLTYLVETLCDCAEQFYNSWPNKSDFDDHKVKIEIR